MRQRNGELHQRQLHVELHQGEAVVDAGQVRNEVMSVDDEDEREAGLGEGWGGGELGREAADEEDGGQEVQSGVDVLQTIAGGEVAVGAALPSGRELHHGGNASEYPTEISLSLPMEERTETGDRERERAAGGSKRGRLHRGLRRGFYVIRVNFVGECFKHMNSEWNIEKRTSFLDIFI